MKNDEAAMATMPAASPSRPSTKFTAFTVTTTSTMVSTVPSTGPRTNEFGTPSEESPPRPPIGR